MKHTGLIVVLLGALLLLFVMFGGSREVTAPTAEEIGGNETPSLEPEMIVVQRPALQFEFGYRKEPNGYVLEERLPKLGDDVNFLGLFGLIREVDFKELQKSTEGRDGPPAITLQAYKNPLNQFARQWADQNSRFSNINLIRGEVEEAIVGGANAIRYTVDGLYAMDTVVITHGGNVYVVSGGYIDIDSEIHTDFQKILDSITFIPEA